jgi:hypothetical protein
MKRNTGVLLLGNQVLWKREMQAPKKKLFTTGTNGGSLWTFLERKDPTLHPGTPSKYEKQLVESGGKLEVRYAVTDSVDKAIDLRNFLLHQHIEEHGRLPLGHKLTPPKPNDEWTEKAS